MATYCTTDEEGRPTAFYIDSVHGFDAIPDEAFEISDEDWQEANANPGRRRFDDEGELVECDMPADPEIPEEDLVRSARESVEARISRDPMIAVLVDLVAAETRISRDEVVQRMTQAMRRR